ncbi:Transmembrane protein 43 [Homalodisca vitripennis]|nr:Transmembrane protein 43 [Homalodisca vitripennis]
MAGQSNQVCSADSSSSPQSLHSTFPVESGVTVSDVVRVGSHTLSGELKEHFSTFTLLTSDQRPERRDIKMHSGLYYHSFDVWSPEVGDTRVQLSYAGAADDLVTILARQVGGMLQPFYVENRDLTAVLEGQHSLSDVLATRFPSSGIWLIRIPAYFAIYCAYSSLLSVFCNRGKSSRLTHVFVSNSKSLLCHVFSAVTLMVVMALTWFRYSLLLGSLNLLAALMLIFYCLSKGYSLYYYFNR